MEMKNWLYSRWTSFAGMLVCLGLLSFAAYLQVQLKLLPCPLCVIQRILIALIALVFLVGSIYTPVDRLGKKIHSGFIMFFSLLGLIVATRHVWLTFQPAGTVVSCSPTLEYMLQNLSLNQTLKLLLVGSGDCARVTYTLLDLSIPEWTLIVFVGFFIFGLLRSFAAKSERGL
jgi:disulfide bond formation protein DsbB